METSRTFEINGKRHLMPGYIVTLIGMVVSFLFLLLGEGKLAVVGGVMLLGDTCIHAVVVCSMTERIVLDEHGVKYRYLQKNKHFLWQDIEWIEMHNVEDGRSRYCRVSFGGTVECDNRVKTDRISMDVPMYACKTVACELRDFARLYTNIEPQIAEKW